jgi:TolB protein
MAEILIAIAIFLALLIATAPKIIKTSNEPRAEVRAAAMALVADMRFLRQRAISLRHPAALVIPNGGCTLERSAGYVMKEGLVGVKTMKIVDFKKLYKDVSLFVGMWDIDPERLHDRALVNDAHPIQGFANALGFDVEKWSGSTRDHVFLFSPEGTVRANPNMPHFDNAYHIIVGRYFTCAPVAARPVTGPGSDSALTRVYKLCEVGPPIYTVAVTPAGEISFSDGVTALSSAVPSNSMAKGAEPAGALPQFSRRQNHRPQILTVSLYPKINRQIYPESMNIDAVISPDEHLRIVVEAYDPDGDHIYLKATTRPPRGSFSVQDPLPMEFDPATGKHRGVLEWFPTEAPGTHTEFTVSAGDAFDTTYIKKRVLMTGRRRIVFISDRKRMSSLYYMNIDGTGVTQVPFETTGELYPSWSPNGGKIAFTSTRRFAEDQIWIVDDDGTGLKNLTSTGAGSPNRRPSWSPDGTKIAFDTVRGGVMQLFMMNADGTDETLIPTQCRYPGHPRTRPTWNNDGTELAFSSCRHPDTDDIQIFKLKGFSQVPCSRINLGALVLERLTFAAGIDEAPSWSPDGRWIAFSGKRGGHEDIYLIRPDGTHPDNPSVRAAKRLTFNGARDMNPSWTPDARHILFQSDRDGNWEIYMMDLDGSNQKNMTDNPANDQMPVGHW